MRPLAGLLPALLLAGCAGAEDPRARPAAPRPAGAPAQTVVLAEWRFRADPRDEGLARGWARDVPGGRPVALPHAANPGPVTGEGAEAVAFGSVGWYEKEVDVRRGGRHALRVSSAHFRTTAWVDGRRLGTHTGAYAPFGWRTRLTRGRHRLVVRVDWRDPAAQAAQGFRRLWFNHGGLHGRVTLTRLGRSELGDPVVRTTLVRGGERARVVVRVRVRNASRERVLAVAGTLRRGGRSVALRFRRVDGAGAGATGGSAGVGGRAGGAADGRVRLGRRRAATLEATTTVPRDALWSVRSPRLWDLDVRVPDETALRRRVGLRELRWDGGRLRLNGVPLRLRGASLPSDAAGRGDAFTARERAEVVRELRAVGANATRSQRPLDEAMLAALDEAGVLVWMEVAPFEPAAAWWATTPARRARATARTVAAVRAARLHPSVLAWSLTNEAARDGHPGGQAAWVDATARAVKRLDPTRPVAADLWGRKLPLAPGLLHRSLDAVGVTDYQGWYEAPLEPPDVQEALAAARVRETLGRFPGKLVVVTEFGAGGTGAGDALGQEGAQAALLARRVRTFRRIEGLDGAIVWTLRDFALRPGFDGGSIRRVAPQVDPPQGILDKGLFRRDGSAKPAVRAVRKAFGGG